jgi:hypothetical protein
MTRKPKKVGRPSTFTKEVGATICKRLAEGESLRRICEDPAMPDRSTVGDWRVRYAEFGNQYARAREEQAHVLFERAMEEADGVALDPVAIQKAKLVVDTIKWATAKLLPKVYGTERVEHAGDAEAPIPIVIKRVNRPDG